MTSKWDAAGIICSVKNRLAVLFALLALVPAAHAQVHRRPSLPPVPQPAGCPPLATLVLGVYAADVELDGTFAYFNDDLGSVYRLPKGSPALSNPELLGTVPGFVNVMALDETTIFMITIDDFDGTLGSLWSMPKSGGTAKLLAGGVLTPYRLAVDATSVYWVSIGTPTSQSFLADGRVEKMAKDGTGRKTLASNLNVPTSIATDGTNVYFSETGISSSNHNAGLRSVPVAGGSVKKLTDGTTVVAVTLRDSDIFFSALDFFAGGELLRMNKSSTTPTSLLKNIDVATSLGVIDDRLYYFNSDDIETLEYIPVTGGTRHIVVNNDFFSAEFALDDCSVYTIDGGASVVRTPR